MTMKEFGSEVVGGSEDFLLKSKTNWKHLLRCLVWLRKHQRERGEIYELLCVSVY